MKQAPAVPTRTRLSSALRLAFICTGVTGLLVACSGDDDDDAPPAPPPPPSSSAATSCPALTTFADVVPGSTMTIKSATLNAAAAPLPEHCELLGAINSRVSTVDGKAYAINFHLRLPTTWNGRFYMMGGGGSNGNLGDAIGSNPTAPGVPSALAQGYAVVSTDSGHDNTINFDANAGGTAAFGADPQARTEYGYKAYDLVTRQSKEIVEYYYGKQPDKSYFIGCSEGGREGFILSQRYPGLYDGILAGDPGFHLPTMGSSAPAYIIQTMAPLAVAAGQVSATGVPLINKTFTDADVQLISQAVVDACDSLDGLADGMSNNLEACTDAVVVPKLTAITCAGAKTPTCLAADQVTAFRKLMAGPQNSQGVPLYTSWPWDPGIGGINNGSFNTSYRSNFLGTFGSANNNLQKLTLSGTVASMVWVSPPAFVATGDPLFNWALNFDLDADFQKVFSPSGIYTESAQQFAVADSTDLSRFAGGGGKLIIYHGNGDPNFSVNDTIAWFKAMNTASGNTASNFARLYTVPGMNHCSGGPATSNFDAVTPLINWVETGAAPASLPASSPNPGFFGVAARSRPLCPYPQWAHYNGTGDINVASNFTCQ